MISKIITYYYKNLIFNLKPKINLDLKLNNKKSLNELFNYYGTDKGSKVKNPFNKKSKLYVGHGFGKFYERYFSKFKNENMNLLEIGAWEGASLASFTNYFPKAQIYGIDRNFKLKYKSNRLNFFYCDTTNQKSLCKLHKFIKNIRFKVIIDDGSHFLKDMIHNIKFFFPYLQGGGYYIIEDYNFPKYYKYLDNSLGEELLIDNIIKKIKKKKFFNSKILNKNFQSNLFRNVTKVDVHKGLAKYKGRNSSDIVFLKKSNKI